MKRHNKQQPCPICGGCDSDTRGKGERCHGFTSDDGEWVNCSREEHAGGSPFNANSETWSHKSSGKCMCGTAHAALVHSAPSVSASGASSRRDRIVDRYSYVDEDGHLLNEVVRLDPKSFRQRQPDGSGGWIWNMKGVRKVPYHLPAIIDAVPMEQQIFIVEGEKDAEAIISVGGVATCCLGGAGKWLDEYDEFFKDAHVVIVPDMDKPGVEHAVDVARHLAAVATSVQVWRTKHGKDVAECLAKTLEDKLPPYLNADAEEEDGIFENITNWEVSGWERLDPGQDPVDNAGDNGVDRTTDPRPDPSPASKGNGSDPSPPEKYTSAAIDDPGNTPRERIVDVDWVRGGDVRPWFDGNQIRVPADREFLFHDLLPRNIVGLVAGEGGIGKGMMMMGMCIAGCIGSSFGPFRSAGSGRWVYVGKEDDRDEQHRRLYWALRARREPLGNEEMKRLAQNLYVPELKPKLKLGPDLVDALGDFVNAVGPVDGILIDPLSRFWDQNEADTMNSQEGAGWAYDTLNEMQKATQATILAVHHVNKEGRKQGEKGAKLTASSVTGSGQIVDLARWAMVIGHISDEKRTELELEHVEAIQSEVVKGNYMSGSQKPQYWERAADGALVPVIVASTLVKDSIILERLIMAHGGDGIELDDLKKKAKQQHSLARRRVEDAKEHLIAQGKLEWVNFEGRKKGLLALGSGGVTGSILNEDSEE